VAGTAVELRPTVDRAWLERAAESDPVAHAYALWDLDHEPDRIRIVSAVAGDTPLGYLLIWLGHPTATVVHWVGSDPRLEALAERLPPRPLLAIVPEEFAATTRAARGPAREFPVLVLRAERGRARGPVPERSVRTLRADDATRLAEFVARQPPGLVEEYRSLAPAREEIWGAVEAGRLIGVCRAAVRRPDVWILGGVYVEEAARGEGWGRSLVATALAAADRAGADLALFVREDRTPARLLYESLGFRPIGRRTWLDAGSGLEP
jgi:ribosomal protein S18 acetylase RimI-like enzyme